MIVGISEICSALYTSIRPGLVSALSLLSQYIFFKGIYPLINQWKSLYTLLYTLHYILHTLHYTLYTIHSKLYTLHFTLHTIHAIVNTIHFQKTSLETYSPPLTYSLNYANFDCLQHVTAPVTPVTVMTVQYTPVSCLFLLFITLFY